MGKRKGGFNWKARQQNETIVDRSIEKKVWIVLNTDSIYTDIDMKNVSVKPELWVWSLEGSQGQGPKQTELVTKTIDFFRSN